MIAFSTRGTPAWLALAATAFQNVRGAGTAWVWGMDQRDPLPPGNRLMQGVGDARPVGSGAYSAVADWGHGLCAQSATAVSLLGVSGTFQAS